MIEELCAAMRIAQGLGLSGTAVVEEPISHTGRPCTGCGECCTVSLCRHARDHGATLPPCPLLRYDGRYWCTLLERTTGPALTALQESLGVGRGCSVHSMIPEAM